MRGRRVLVARAAEARDVLPDGLRERGAEVDVLALVRHRGRAALDGQRRALKRCSYMTFTSSSTVRFFLEGGGVRSDDARVASIGPVTSTTLREHGIDPHVEAARHDIDGLVDAIVEDVRR